MSNLIYHYIQAGNIVMLVSQKIDGYVSAKGLRRWQKSFFNNIPFSGDTFLELEGSNDLSTKTSISLRGTIKVSCVIVIFCLLEPLMYGDRCRIKIFLTQEPILKVAFTMFACSHNVLCFLDCRVFSDKSN